MAHVIALPLSTQPRRATVSHVWPAEITDMADLYENAARHMRAQANAASVRGEADLSRLYRVRSRQYDEIAFKIKGDTETLARARAREMAAQIIKLTNERAG